MNFRWSFTLLFLLTAAQAAEQPSPGGLRQAGESAAKLNPKVHKNHVRRASAEFLGAFRRIAWYYDFGTAAELARETGRPMFVLFCRSGTIDDPITGEPRCAS
jgi:hypothetical protein